MNRNCCNESLMPKLANQTSEKDASTPKHKRNAARTKRING